MVSQKHCNEPKNGFGGENGGWCIGDALRAPFGTWGVLRKENRQKNGMREILEET